MAGLIVARKGWLYLALGVMVIGLPLAGKWLQPHTGERCALDGVAIEPVYRVRVVDAAGTERPFCCIKCATVWLTQQPTRPRAVFVTDEITGTEIPASEAYFVRSLVVTTPATGNSIHAFKEKADAQRHADSAGVSILTGSERPFAGISNQ